MFFVKTRKIFLTRAMYILPSFFAKPVYIHNGKTYKRFVILRNMFYKTAGTLFFSKKKQSFKIAKKKQLKKKK